MRYRLHLEVRLLGFALNFVSDLYGMTHDETPVISQRLARYVPSSRVTVESVSHVGVVANCEEDAAS